LKLKKSYYFASKKWHCGRVAKASFCKKLVQRVSEIRRPQTFILIGEGFFVLNNVHVEKKHLLLLDKLNPLSIFNLIFRKKPF